MSIDDEVSISATDVGYTVETDDGQVIHVDSFFGDPVVIEAIVDFDISDPRPPSIIDGGYSDSGYIHIIDGGDSSG